LLGIKAKSTKLRGKKMMSLIRRSLFAAGLACAMASSSFAGEVQNVYFAGFSFAGNFDQNHERYPVAEALAKKHDANGMPLLDAALREQLQRGLKRTDIQLKDSLGDLASQDSTAVAFALEQESHEDVPRGSQELYIYRVIAEVLVFNFQTKTVLAEFPAMAQFQDIDAPGRTELEHRKVFERMYTEPAFGANIFAEWVRRLDVTRFSEGDTYYLAVRDVTIAPEVESMLRAQAIDPGVYRTEVAQELEYSLASKQNVALLPYTEGQAIGAKMAGRFVNGDSYMLALPKPDFTIDLKVQPFQTRHAETAATDQYAFGAFVNLRVEQPDLQKTYLDADFRNVNFVAFAKSSATKPDTWQSYQTSQRALFQRLAEQVSARDAKVLSDMTRAPDIGEQLRGFQEVLKKCM
jgi:hypothetical protein